MTPLFLLGMLTGIFVVMLGVAGFIGVRIVERIEAHIDRKLEELLRLAHDREAREQMQREVAPTTWSVLPEHIEEPPSTGNGVSFSTPMAISAQRDTPAK